MFSNRLFITNEEIKKVLEINSSDQKTLYEAYKRLDDCCVEILMKYRKLKRKISQLRSRIFVAYSFSTWQIQEPPIHPIDNPKVLNGFYKKFDIHWMKKEIDSEFRDKYFKGKERLFLLLGLYNELRLKPNVLDSEFQEEKIRNGYILELRKEYDKAIDLYNAAAYKDRLEIINKLKEKQK
mgnify:CR=1 FL=1